jgi:hypothetical protein
VNFNAYLDQLLAEPAADSTPRLAADRTKPHPRSRRPHRAADGTLLATDSIPLAEAIGAPIRPCVSTRRRECDLSSTKGVIEMQKETLIARDFAKLVNIHANSGDNVSRELIKELKPETRAAFHKIASDLCDCLKPTVGTGILRDTVETGIGNAAVAAAPEGEDTEDLTEAEREAKLAGFHAVADAMPGIFR